MNAPRQEIERIKADYDSLVSRHRARIYPVRVLAARPRFFIAIAIGIVAGLLPLGGADNVSRALVGWNAAAIGYIALVIWSMRESSHRRIRLQAQMLDDGKIFVLAFSTLAAVAAIGAIVVELGSAKSAEGMEKAWRLGLAACTIFSSWAFIHMVFALHYAHEYYLERGVPDTDGKTDPFDLDGDGDVDETDAELASDARDPRGGLIFPDTAQPTYIDFVYFSYIIGVASQTADVELSSRPMRAVSLAHSILSFFFNTTILALTINLAAGLF